jgi:hypothetical protein
VAEGVDADGQDVELAILRRIVSRTIWWAAVMVGVAGQATARRA